MLPINSGPIVIILAYRRPSLCVAKNRLCSIYYVLLFPISRDFIYFGIVRKNQVSISLHIT